MNDAKPHHHGDLRAALIGAALDLLAAGGRDALTLRKAAARAGVSHAAPAHHFDGLDGLLRAVAARGFAIFADCMRVDRAAMPGDAQSQLLGIAQGYLRFASDHEALFDLIFSVPMKNSTDPDLQAASADAFAVLCETCALFEPDPAGPMVNEIRVWSVVHGYTILRQFNRLQSSPDGPVMPVALVLPQMVPLRTP
jgi:AcrR family transcriptional regulator